MPRLSVGQHKAEVALLWSSGVEASSDRLCKPFQIAVYGRFSERIWVVSFKGVDRPWTSKVKLKICSKRAPFKKSDWRFQDRDAAP